MEKKSEIIDEIYRWAKKKLKEQRKRVKSEEEKLEKTRKQCQFEDEECIVYATEQDLAYEKGRLSGILEMKIGLEKYMKKCKHEEDEREKMEHPLDS